MPQVFPVFVVLVNAAMAVLFFRNRKPVHVYVDSIILSDGLGRIETRVNPSQWVEIIVTRYKLNEQLPKVTLSARLNVADIKRLSKGLCLKGEVIYAEPLRVEGQPVAKFRFILDEYGGRLSLTHAPTEQYATVFLSQDELNWLSESLARV